jgi:hypothetical protein
MKVAGCGGGVDETAQLLHECYRQIVEAIKRENYLDVFYSTFILLVYCFMSKYSTIDILNHCTGLWDSFAKLQEREHTLGEDELDMMEMILQRVLQSFVQQNYNMTKQYRQILVEPMASLLKFLDSCNFERELTYLSRYGSNRGLTTLAIHLHLSFDQYLFCVDSAQDSEHSVATKQYSDQITSLQRSLATIIVAIRNTYDLEIRTLTNQLNHNAKIKSFQSSAAEDLRLVQYQQPQESLAFLHKQFTIVVLYYSCVLIFNTLPPIYWYDNTGAISAARVLSQLCLMPHICDCLAVRTLFLAGLVLTEAVDKDSMHPIMSEANSSE